MDLKQQLVFCKQCEKRAFGDTGILCSLTKQKPAFKTSCDSFTIDPKEAQRIALRANENKLENSNSNSTWIYIGIALIVIRIIIRIARN